MKKHWTAILLAAALTAAGAHAASRTPRFDFLSASEAAWAAAYLRTETPARAWVWTNDYVYQPGQQLKAWWTVKPLADLYPVTLVVYVQNNQTGEKSYLPNNTSQPTDIFGNTLKEGFLITRVPEAEKSPLIGPGGLFPAWTVPDELGMHTLVVEFRDYTGNSVLKRLYQKISVVDEIVNVTAPIEQDTTWVRTKSYVLQGTIIVRNATLTIESGTVIKGQPGSQPASALVIRRDSRLIARGTRNRPIIMTSALPVGNRQPGDWGGLVLTGSASLNSGVEDTVEGLPPGEDSVMGGTNDVDSCGELTYVRVEFAGAELSQDNELNSFTFGACGSGTVAHHLQSHYGFDDSFEWFGGTMNAKYLVATAGGDDGFDIQRGFRGKVQHFVAVFYDDNPGDHGIEADNLEENNSAEPFSAPVLFNATFVGNGPEVCRRSCDGARWRRGLKGSFNNIVLTNFFDDTLDIRDPVTEQNIDDGELTANGILAWGNKGGTDNTIEGQFKEGIARDFATSVRGTGKNIVVADPQFRSTVLSDWDLRPAPGSPLTGPRWELPPADGFFDPTARYCGAFGEGDDWTEEWTNKKRETDLLVQ